MIRVGLADDQSLVRAGFRAIVESESDLEIVGEASDGDEAIALARTLRPDVICMDIRMPRRDGLAATRAICSDPATSAVRVLILTTFELDEYVFEALAAGASGFLVKHADPDDLARAIRVIAAGDALLSPGVTRRLVRAFARGTTPGADAVSLGSLTDRERAAVRLVADGRSNTEIAGAWFVSEATVRTHVSRAMAKLHARDRAQLVVIAFRSGLARP